MNLFLNNIYDINKTVSRLICFLIATDKNDFLVKYATGGLSNKIFVSKYKTYLPNQKQLENKVKEIINKKTK